MNKLKLIIAREFKTKVKNKSFIVMTFLSPLIIVLMLVLFVFLTKENDQKVKEIIYVDNSDIFSEDNFEDTETIKYKNFTSLGIIEAKKEVEQGNHFGLLSIAVFDLIV